MLFLIVQDHTPDNCPVRSGQGPESLFDDAPGIDVRFAVADVPGHRLVFLVETDSYEALQTFLEPGRGRTITNISPVTSLR